MSHEIEQQPARRSFFQARAFWTGNVLWLIAIAMGVVAWNQKPRVNSTAQSVAAAEQQDEKPKQITITTDKDGNPKVVQPGENPDAPWDKDGIADFTFTDTEGQKISKADLLGKPWIVCFVFTHCAATCPAVTNSMRELQDQLKAYDFRLVTITVDPARDTTEVLKSYGKTRGADFKKWSFLNGDQRDIYRLIHGSFKMPVQELPEAKKQQGFEFIHSNNIMLVDDKGVVRGKFDATNGPAVVALKREIQKMAKRTDAASESPPK